jgi:uncharacterized protein YxjI
MFLLRQKALSINEKYFVYDERGAPLMFVERPRHLIRNLGAVILGMFAGLFVFMGFGAASNAFDGTSLATGFGFLAPFGFFLTFLLVSMGLSKKRHITIHRGATAAGEKLLEVKQEKKLELITATYTMRDSSGRVVALFRKNFLYNIIRRRWHVLSVTGATVALAKEDSIIKSLLRRVLGPMFGLLRTNFIFLHPSGAPAYGELKRTFTILDRYVLDLTADAARNLDRRVALALGVLLDTGERR